MNLAAQQAAAKDPKGGLTAAGRRSLARKEGAQLKPGVRKPASGMTPDEMRRKGSWATRFYGRTKLPPLLDSTGRPTRFALSAHAWGEPVPVRSRARAERWYSSQMLVDRFVSFVSRTARGKRLLWRGWYQFLAARYRDPRWTFMNYGYQSPEGPAPRLDPSDEPDRSYVQLYDIVARGAPVAGRDLLEVGCGRGGGAAYVARALGPRHVVGIDLSPRAIALCRARFRQPNLSFQVGDAEQLPFGDASFDAVLNVESSHCYGRLPVFLREVRRVLRPGGHFLYADFRPAREIAGWRAELRDAGFEIAVERDLRPGVVAALDADDAHKRAFIESLVDRPLLSIFGEFAALRGSMLNDALRRGEVGYRAFVLTAPGVPQT